MAVNKIIIDANTKIDLTGTTVTADTMLVGSTAIDKHGEEIEGACTYDSDTTDATATQDEILATKTAYGNKAKLTGRMPNNGSVNVEITTRDQIVRPAQGYHDGGGSVQISATERAKIIPANIAENVVILGQKGTHKSGSQEVKQSKTVTPTFSEQTFTPDEGYTCFSQFTVSGIQYTETQNAYGTTITVG